MGNITRSAFRLNLKLRSRIMLFYILFILIPLLAVGIGIYLSISGTLADYMMEGTVSSLDQSAQAIENTIKGMEKTLNIVAADKRTNTMLTSISSSKYRSIADQAADHIAIINMFMPLQRISGLLKLRIYVPHSFYYASENDQFSALKDLLQKPWYAGLANGESAFAYYLDSYVDYAQTKRDVLSVTRLVRDPTDYSRYIAAVTAECNVSDIETKLSAVGGGLAFLCSDSGQIIGTRERDLGSWNSMAGNLPAGRWVNVKDQKNGDGFAFSRNIAETGWRLIFVMPASELFRVRNQRMLLLIAGFVFLTGATIVFAYYVSALSAKRLERLIENMRRVQSGDFDITMDAKGSDEIGEITGKFNTMVLELRELLKIREELKERIKQTELSAVRSRINALQSQINPHFLYNTLDSILWKALYNDIPKVEKLVQSLADFYRLTLNSGSDIVTVNHELLHVESYVAIQNIRFDGNIRLESDVGEAGACLLPNVTLQPLVENALLHGMVEHGRKSGLIQIIGSVTENKTVRLTVSDDGAGMPVEVLDRLNSIIPNGAGMGVANVKERIGLYFGKEFGLQYSSTKSGTTVVIEVPMKTDPKTFLIAGLPPSITAG